MRIRSIHSLRRIGVVTALGMVFGWTVAEQVAGAAPDDSGERILLGAIVDSCQNSAEGYRAVISRLRQLGANVETPPMGHNDCVGLACATTLKGKPAFLMGGQVSVGQSTLWIADLARDLVLVQRHVGYGVNWPNSLARQAAALVEQLHDPLARWTPRAQVSSCGEPPTSSAETSVPTLKEGASAEQKVVLAVHAPRSVGKYAADFQKGVRRALGEMGLQVREVRGVAPPANPRDALPSTLKELPLIDIQLLESGHDKKATTPDGTVVRFLDGSRSTQTSIECAAQDCEPAQLVQFVRRNAVSMLDRGIADVETVAPPLGAGACVPADACLAQAEHTTPFASNPPHADPSAAPLVTAHDLSSGSPSAPLGTPTTMKPVKSVLPFWVGGSLSLFVGVGGIALGTGLAAVQGQRHEGVTCSYYGQPNYNHCIYDNKPLIAIGFVGGAALVVAGSVLLRYARKYSAVSQ